VELEQRDTESGEMSYRNSAEEYLDKNETKKARGAVMQSGKRKEARQADRQTDRHNITVCSLEMNFKLVSPSFRR
jgi:hypothetical protein